MLPIIQLTDAPDLADKAAAEQALYLHNAAKTGVMDRRPIACVAVDPTSGEVMGGLWGRTEIGVLFLDMFYLPETLRGTGFGTRLLEAVEGEARDRGCRRAVVETSSFQAPEFYRRHGYMEFGRVPFALSGHARVFLRKDLVNG